MTFRLRLAVPLAVILATLLVAFSLTVNRLSVSRSDVTAEREQVLGRLLTQLQDTISSELAENDLTAAHRELVSRALDPQVITLLLADDQDRVIIAGRLAWKGEPASAVSRYDRAIAASIRERWASRVVPQPGGEELDGYAAVALGSRPGDVRPTHFGTLYVEYDLGPILARARSEALRDAAWLCLPFVAFALVLALLLHFVVTRNVERLGKVVAAVAAGDSGARSRVRGPGEIARLAQAFDAMADQLASSHEALRELNAELERRVEERTSQLARAYNELEGFSYSVSHDLRSPLRAIDGFSLLLLEEYRDRLDDEGRRLLGVVRENTLKMGRLIDDILAFSRTGRTEMSMADVDMAQLVRDVVEELGPASAGRQVELRVGELPPARGDRTMLRQVLVNLIGNALKFTRDRSPACIEIDGVSEGGRSVYRVKDNGAGFDMRYAEKLFGVFHRLHRVDEFDGTGIGLAIVKRIVERHGGRVWGEGRVGEGATFHFELPGKDESHG